MAFILFTRCLASLQLVILPMSRLFFVILTKLNDDLFIGLGLLLMKFDNNCKIKRRFIGLEQIMKLYTALSSCRHDHHRPLFSYATLVMTQRPDLCLEALSFGCQCSLTENGTCSSAKGQKACKIILKLRDVVHLDSLNHFSATVRLAENGAMLLCVWFLNKKDYYSAHTVVITHNATAFCIATQQFFYVIPLVTASYNQFLQKLISDGIMAIFL